MQVAVNGLLNIMNVTEVLFESAVIWMTEQILAGNCRVVHKQNSLYV